MAIIINSFKIKILKRGYNRMTLDFGYTYSDGSFHKGIDLTGDPNVNGGYDTICAVADGTVISMRNSLAEGQKNSDGMGNYVTIEHPDGIRTRYMHMSKGSVVVKSGQKVKKGQKLGEMGSTGNSTGRHLHFDISYDRRVKDSYRPSDSTRYYVDPKPFLRGEKAIGYETGLYQTIADLNVRSKPSANSAKVNFANFTQNAKEQVMALDKTAPNYFPKGIRVSISEVDGTWGKCPSGWISMNFLKKI